MTTLPDSSVVFYLSKSFTGQQYIKDHKELAEELYHFEDHYILKGRMSAIELDPRTLKQYRAAFAELFSSNVDRNTISRAVLCFGDYRQGNGDRWRFANSDKSWHATLTSADVSKIKGSLKLLFEAMKSNSLEDIIINKISEFSNADRLSWEYYFIQYPEMNQGGDDAYFVWRSDFDICMLNTTRLSGYWRDPYLWTVYCHFANTAEKEQIKDIWNIGGDKRPATICGIELSMCDDGWSVLLGSTDATTQIMYQYICEKYGIIGGIIKVSVDVDRIKKGVDLIKDIISY